MQVSRHLTLRHWSFVSFMRVGTLVGVVAASAACSTAEKRFDRITPGMSTTQVQKVMDSGPSRFETIPNTDFASWYWGDDYCVLFKSDQVIAKNRSETGRSVSVGPGQYEESRKAVCLAPGQVSDRGTDRTVTIPGIGTIHLPAGGGGAGAGAAASESVKTPSG